MMKVHGTVEFKSEGTLCDSSFDSGMADGYRHPHSFKEVRSQLFGETHDSNLSLSPRRRLSHKEKKQHLRAVLGISSSETIFTTSTKTFEKSVTETPQLHYFWGSRLWISIYLIIIASALFRQIALLHGISVVILWHMIENVISWGLFVSQSKEVKAIVQHLRWTCKFAFKNVEKAAEGDTLRGFLATKTFNFWTGPGKTFLTSFFRQQSRDIRMRALKESMESLNRQIHEKRKSMPNALVFHGRSNHSL